MDFLKVIEHSADGFLLKNKIKITQSAEVGLMSVRRISADKENPTIEFSYNEVELKKLNLTEQELQAGVCHEIGHIKLGHLSLTQNQLAPHFLCFLLIACFIYTPPFDFLRPVIFVLLCAGFIHHLKCQYVYRKMELQADASVATHMSPIFLYSLLVKAQKFSMQRSYYSYLLQEKFNCLFSHPSYSQRLKQLKTIDMSRKLYSI